MPKQTINLGSVANDGTGTQARAAGDIINDNFTELYDALAKLANSSVGYCSVDGNDTTGDGTPGNPWRQPSKAVTEGKKIIVMGPGSFSSAVTINYSTAEEYVFIGVPGKTIMTGSVFSIVAGTTDMLTMRLSGVALDNTLSGTPYGGSTQTVKIIGTQSRINSVYLNGSFGSDETPSGEGGTLNLEGSTLYVDEVQLDPGTDGGGGEGSVGSVVVKHAEIGFFSYNLSPPGVTPYHAIISNTAYLDAYP